MPPNRTRQEQDKNKTRTRQEQQEQQEEQQQDIHPGKVMTLTTYKNKNNTKQQSNVQ